MNIFEINEITKSNIVSFGELNLTKVACILIKRNLLNDAKLVLQHVNTKISCRNKHMIKWLYTRDLLEFTASDMSYICRNGLKIEFTIASSISTTIPYEDCVHSPHFFNWVMKDVEHINKPIYTHNLSLLTYLSSYQYFDEAYINRVCIDGNLASFKYLIKLTSTNPNKFYKTALIYNHSHFFNFLNIQNISKHTYILCMKNKAYHSIRLSHSLCPTLFTVDEHTDMFKRILCYNTYIPFDFFTWYKSMTKPVNVSIALCKSKNTFILSSFYNICVKKHFIIAAKYNNLSLIKLLTHRNSISVIMEALFISCIAGHASIAKYLCNYIYLDEFIYLVLYKMISINSPHEHIIKWLYEKNKQVYPSMIPLYAITNQTSFSWIKDNLHIFFKQIDNYYNAFQYYINLICHYGHSKLFIELFKFIQEEHSYQYFINACENKSGLFIAHYLLHTFYISPKTIEMAFYNSTDIDIIQWLYNPNIDIRKNNDHYFLFSCLNNHVDIAIWLTTICPQYSCIIVDNKIISYKVSLSCMLNNLLTFTGDCSICLSTASNCKTICNHEYCYHCINTWFDKNRTCPICRQEIDMVYTIDDIFL